MSPATTVLVSSGTTAMALASDRPCSRTVPGGAVGSARYPRDGEPLTCTGTNSRLPGGECQPVEIDAGSEDTGVVYREIWGSPSFVRVG